MQWWYCTCGSCKWYFELIQPHLWREIRFSLPPGQGEDRQYQAPPHLETKFWLPSPEPFSVPSRSLFDGLKAMHIHTR